MSLEHRSASWDADPEASRAAISAAISLVLRLLGKDPDPAKSREHVLLAVLAERRLQQGQTAELGSLLDEVLTPPMDRIGALAVDDFLPLKERKQLAASLNTHCRCHVAEFRYHGVPLQGCAGACVNRQNGIARSCASSRVIVESQVGVV